MNEKDKLKHLVGHWKEHNLEHARTYRTWSEKAGISGEPGVKDKLNELASAAEGLNLYLDEIAVLLA